MKSHDYPGHNDREDSPRERVSAESIVRLAIEHLREWIPSQGPIGVFVHHNTLHHFEHMSFEDAVEKVGSEVGAQPYLKHTEYLEAWRQGRIDDEAIDRAVDQAKTQGEFKSFPAHGPMTLESFLLSALQIPWQGHTRASLIWQTLKAGSLPPQFKGPVCQPLTKRAAFWCECLPPVATRLSKLFKELPSWVRLEKGERFPPELVAFEHKEQVNKLTISFVASYLDQGIAHFSLPRDKELGLWASVRHYFDPKGRAGKSEVSWREDLLALWEETDGTNSIKFVSRMLHALDVPERQWSDFIMQDNLSTSGWAGLCHMLEQNPALYPGEIRKIDLSDLVALRLALHLALREKSAKTEASTSSTISTQTVETWIATMSYQMVGVFEAAALSATTVHNVSDSALISLTKQLWDFGDAPRRRLLHQAYERTFQNRMLRALHSQSHSETRRRAAESLATRPLLQAAFCIDEREESLRRHLEERCPDVETYGAAGFFGVAVAYQDANVPRPVPLCPVLVTPKHLVTGESSPKAAKNATCSLPQKAAQLPEFIHLHGRRLWFGQVVHLAAGFIGAVELLVRTAAPGLTKKVAAWVHRHDDPGKSSLHFTRVEDDTPKPTILGDLLAGFKAEEMADRVAGLLKTIGLTQNFSRLVFLIGHGSTTNNNPFASAYECGACGGRRGDRNGRIFAQMANRPEVRALVAQRGVTIPDDTVFVGGCHDTCADTLDLFDIEAFPKSHLEDLKRARSYFNAALAANAHERCRRFDNARHLGVPEAHQHVIQRSFNMREPRPEYGHGSNAACIIGHRQLTRGLFLDRRSFLVSYDWRQDATGKILEAILGAVMPVCSGINLEYYFSRIDNRRYGAGTKLPHNVVSMMGVMDGLISDLRTGLPWQTVEIHEPMRLMTVIEAPVERIRAALSQLPMVANLLNKKWIFMTFHDPVTHETGWLTADGIELFHDKMAAIPIVPASQAYYQGRSEHLAPVTVQHRSQGRAV